MVPNTEKLMEVFIEGLPQSIEGAVTASKPQTLEEATNIAQRLMDQIVKHGSMQGTNDHKRKFDDRRNTTNNDNYPNIRINNYQNNRNNNSNRNNDYRQQQNKRQEICRAYDVTPTKNNRNCKNKGPATRSNLQPVSFVNHQPQEIPEVIPFIESKEWSKTKNELYKIVEAYTERINQQREQEALLVAQREQELLAQKQAAQEKEEPPQNSDFRQLIGKMCGTKVCEEQKQNMEDTMLELLEDFRQKELYCMHNDIEDLIEREYSQWVERFMNYLKEQNDGEAMINSIKNGDQPLPRVTQVSIAGTTLTEQPHLKVKSMWSDQEKRIQKIDHLARS
nr:hypothetical protein [Tanacetum cinerariifolium]